MENAEQALLKLIKQYVSTDENMNLADGIHLLGRKLQEAELSLEQFTFIAAHHLQEPLRSISSIAEIMEEQYSGKIDDQADNYFRFILQASNRMSQLMKALLDHSRIGAKQREKQQVNCNEIIDIVKEDLRQSIQASGASIEVNTLPVITAYQEELTMLFQHLLSNAIKFRKEGQSPVINIGACSIDNGWLFSFCDNGIGIENRFREKIFGMFQRLHNQNLYEGTGMGLAHCRKIVVMHNGKIWIESAPGRGSQFYFTISA